MSSLAIPCFEGCRRPVHIVGRRDVAGYSKNNSSAMSNTNSSTMSNLPQPPPSDTDSVRQLSPKQFKEPFKPFQTQKFQNKQQTYDDGPKKRKMISPTRWFKVEQSKARSTMVDSPSHATAIASLKSNNQVKILREHHSRMIASAIRHSKPSNGHEVRNCSAHAATISCCYER